MSRYSDWLRAWRPGDWIPVVGEIFRTCPYRPWGPPSLVYNGYRVFPGGKERPGRDTEPSPPSSAVGHERVELYLYSRYGPYGLYRASVPVQGCTLLYQTCRLLLVPRNLTECWLYWPGSKVIRLAYLSVLQRQKHKKRYKVVTSVYTQHFCAGRSCDE